MTKALLIISLVTLSYFLAFAWITTYYEPNVADQYESAEPQPMSLQRYHDTNMDGEK